MQRPKGPVTMLMEHLAEKEQENRDLKDKYLRALADLDNYRKRMQKENEDLRKYALVEMFHRIIPVLDNFTRACSGAEMTDDLEHYRKGIEIIHRQLQEELKNLGLTEFSSAGEMFDPARHEAVGVVETDDCPEGTIVEEISRGYQVCDRVIKPAKVCVARPCSKGEEQNGEDNRN